MIESKLLDWLAERCKQSGRVYSTELAQKGAEMGLKPWQIVRFRKSCWAIQVRKEQKMRGSRWFICLAGIENSPKSGEGD